MNQYVSVILKGLLSLIIITALVCCSKLLENGEGIGRNILHFSINSESVSQVERGVPMLHNFRTVNGLFLSSPLSFAAFNSDDDGYTTIRAVLNSPTYYELRMKMPTDKISEGVTCSPEVSLYYVLLPQIREKRYTDETGFTHYKTIRQAVYGKAQVSEASLKVRSYFPENDPRKGKPRTPTLCGNFSFSGHYKDSLENVISFKVVDGYFDVSDSPVIFGRTPRENGWLEYDTVVLED